ncbi:hypothetical protein [Amycolatopsis sp. TNS106]|uniref:hypothetical protein n=1 Tax=Amycolatopsis sp. TNS106 TaxID=2861750 RepID=UPI001C59BBA0|nr:hypothetical protein [Amycolatopsis sp. TNS106]
MARDRGAPGSAALDEHPEDPLPGWTVSVIREGLTSCADESYRLATTAKDWPLSPFLGKPLRRSA